MLQAHTLAAEAEELEELVEEVFITEEMDFCYLGIQLDMVLEEEHQDTLAMAAQDLEAKAGEMLVLEQAVPQLQQQMLKKAEQQE